MARIRTIKPEFFEDEALGECSRDARYLFVGLISHSDDHGRQRGNPRLILANVFPYDPDIAHTDVAGWLAELVRAGVIQLYEKGRQQFVQVVNWGKHQRVDKVKDSALPATDDPEATLAAIPMNTGAREGGANLREAGATEGKGREEDTEGIATTSLVELVFDYWRERCNHGKTKLDPKRHRAISGRVREGVTLEEFKEGIEGAARGAFVNAAGQRFDDIELICRDRVKLDSFRARQNLQAPPTSDAARSARRLEWLTEGAA